MKGAILIYTGWNRWGPIKAVIEGCCVRVVIVQTMVPNDIRKLFINSAGS